MLYTRLVQDGRQRAVIVFLPLPYANLFRRAQTEALLFYRPFTSVLRRGSRVHVYTFTAVNDGAYFVLHTQSHRGLFEYSHHSNHYLHAHSSRVIGFRHLCSTQPVGPSTMTGTMRPAHCNDQTVTCQPYSALIYSRGVTKPRLRGRIGTTGKTAPFNRPIPNRKTSLLQLTRRNGCAAFYAPAQTLSALPCTTTASTLLLSLPRRTQEHLEFRPCKAP
jgi:hypothetical protein